MWAAGISVNLPVWSYRKQNRAVAESRARADASAGGEAIEQVLRRVAERRSAYEAVVETAGSSARGCSCSPAPPPKHARAVPRRKVTFASVLEANAGYIGDEEASSPRSPTRSDRDRRRG